MMKAKQKISVLFVCMGNICRSPTAEIVFAALVEKAGLSEQFQIDSAGTHDYHIGEAPDGRTQRAALRRGYDMSQLRGRQVDVTDFARFDYILAMDEANLMNLKKLNPNNSKGYIGLFLAFAEQPQAHEVPDPYYGGADGFEKVLDLVEDTAHGLLRHIQQHDLGGSAI
jgi:protein-tyrosine phosphatase